MERWGTTGSGYLRTSLDENSVRHFDTPDFPFSKQKLWENDVWETGPQGQS